MANNEINNITEKLFTTSVRIYPKEHLTIDATIIEKIKSAYVGKCYKGVFIISILDITKRGLLIIDKDSRGGKGNVDVEFRATIIRYNVGDLICNAKIFKVTPISYVIQTPYSKGLIHLATNLTVKKGNEGDLIPITISSSAHYPGANDISLIGSLLNFPKAVYFKLKNNPKDVDIQSYKNIELAPAVIKKLSKYDDVIVKFNNKNIKGVEKPLSYFNSLKEGDIICKPMHLSRFSGFIIIDKNEQKNIDVIEQYSSLIFTELLEDYVKFTRLYMAMDEIYTTSDFTTFKKYYS